MRTQRLIDVVGPNPVLHSWGYANAYMRAPERKAPLPNTTFLRSKRTGLWLPLECVVGVTIKASAAHDSGGGGSSFSTSSFTPAAGSTLLAFTRNANTGGGVVSITHASGTFTKRASDETTDPNMTSWSLENASASAGVATVSWGAVTSNYAWLVIVEVTGVDTSSYDTSGAWTKSNATLLLSTAITTSVAVEAVVMSCSQNNFADYTAHVDSDGNTWTMLNGIIGESGHYGGIQYFVTSSSLSSVTAKVNAGGDFAYTTTWIAVKSTGGAASIANKINEFNQSVKRATVY